MENKKIKHRWGMCEVKCRLTDNINEFFAVKENA